jgi:predicted transcriptional regulator
MTAVELARHLNVSVDQIERSLLRLIANGLVAEKADSKHGGKADINTKIDGIECDLSATIVRLTSTTGF